MNQSNDLIGQVDPPALSILSLVLMSGPLKQISAHGQPMVEGEGVYHTSQPILIGKQIQATLPENSSKDFENSLLITTILSTCFMCFLCSYKLLKCHTVYSSPFNIFRNIKSLNRRLFRTLQAQTVDSTANPAV